MKQSITKKLFALFITSISFLSMGCGDDKQQIESDGFLEYRSGYQVELRIILTGLEDQEDYLQHNEFLPKIGISINGTEHQVSLDKEKFILPFILDDGEHYGVSMDQDFYQFSVAPIDSDGEAVYNMLCQLNGEAGVAGENMDNVILICDISLIPPPDVIIEG